MNTLLIVKKQAHDVQKEVVSQAPGKRKERSFPGSPGSHDAGGACARPSMQTCKSTSRMQLKEFFIYIYFITILLKYIVRYKFSKIYICRCGPWRQGLNVVAHGGRSLQEWAHSPNATGHGVMSLTPWAAASGA
jgi:hypothetical protein